MGAQYKTLNTRQADYNTILAEIRKSGRYAAALRVTDDRIEAICFFDTPAAAAHEGWFFHDSTKTPARGGAFFLARDGQFYASPIVDVIEVHGCEAPDEDDADAEPAQALVPVEETEFYDGELDDIVTEDGDFPRDALRAASARALAEIQKRLGYRINCTVGEGIDTFVHWNGDEDDPTEGSLIVERREWIHSESDTFALDTTESEVAAVLAEFGFAYTGEDSAGGDGAVRIRRRYFRPLRPIPEKTADAVRAASAAAVVALNAAGVPANREFSESHGRIRVLIRCVRYADSLTPAAAEIEKLEKLARNFEEANPAARVTLRKTEHGLKTRSGRRDYKAEISLEILNFLKIAE